MTDLNIPDEVFAVAFAAAKADDTVAMGASMGAGVFRVLPDIVQVAVRVAAPLIVAAELSRIAADLIKQWGHVRADDPLGYGLNEAVRQLQDRASELRGEAVNG